jgi:hypothetical protein
MPNRYTRESAIESESVNSLTWMGEVFYRRLINRADDFGRHSADARILRAKIFPLQLDRVTERDVIRLLKENEDAGLLFTYLCDGKQFLVMNKWEKGRAKESDYPDPPPEVCEHMRTYVYKRKQMRTHAPDSDSDSDSDSNTDTDTVAVESVYLEYPKKAAKPDALRAISKALKKTKLCDLIAKTRAYAQAAVGQNPQYIPYPASWFNAQRYNDAPETWFAKSAEQELPGWKVDEEIRRLEDEFKAAASDAERESIRARVNQLKRGRK